MKDRIKIFTWHIHGSYLYYLSQGDYDIYIPTKPKKQRVTTAGAKPFLLAKRDPGAGRIG
jgi:hypothetical protein